MAFRINTTFLDWLRTLGIDPQLRVPIYAAAICAGVLVFFWVVYQSESVLELMSILLLVSYALTPYALQYDYPPLVMVLFWALSLCVSSPRAMGIGLALAGFALSVILWQKNISWAYWIVIGLIVLTSWGLSQQRLRNLDHKKKLPQFELNP